MTPPQRPHRHPSAGHDEAQAGHRRIERLAFRARPSLETIEFDGWVLRFANGYTKRANSVNPHFGSTRPLAEKIATCEEHYAERGLPTIFRLTPFSCPPELDPALAESGYELLDRSLVLTASIDPPPSRDSRDVRCIAAGAWFAAFDRLRTPEPAVRAIHRTIVEAADGAHRFAIVEDEGEPLACGLAVLVDDAVGLFDLFTAEPYRRRGHGAAIVAEALRWAAGRGARTAFLQVHGENDAALRLYARFGFAVAYPYWYRARP